MKATEPKRIGLMRNHKFPPKIMFTVMTQKDFRKIPFRRKNELV